jgi:hypothetical protein
MATKSVTTCDLCGKEVPTREPYEIKRMGLSIVVDLCSEHAEPFDKLLQSHGEPVVRVLVTPTHKARTVTMEELGEIMKRESAQKQD